MSVEAVLLGLAQDGGSPQAGCGCDNCQRAWANPALRQWAACLGLVDRTTDQIFLIDATPDFREQLHLLQDLAPGSSLAGVVLTHAHVGHYAGLIHTGREVMNTGNLPVYVTRRMASFLRSNAPWSQLVTERNIDLRILKPMGTTDACSEQLSPLLQITPILVPHRDEFSDAVAMVVQGPARRLFYCPDIDSWHSWNHDLWPFLADMDVALLDATFWSTGELLGRSVGEVPHPVVRDTVARLAGTTCEVRLIHLNHTNPLLASGPERDWVAAQGVDIGISGQRWSLG
jgi:pyrroloquinoline quinone biosynthesis protein B